MHRPLNITDSRFGTDFKRGDEKMSIYIKPKIHIDFDSPEGNVFHILAYAREAIKTCCIFEKQEKLKEFDERIEQVKNQGYEKVLEVVREYVEIIED